MDNKYAQKWTPEAVKECLDKIGQDARNEDVLYLGEALTRQHISRKSWSYWKKIFAGDEDIMEQIDLIEGTFESRLFTGALRSKMNASIAIFGLKNNHHWSDKPAEQTEEKEARPPMYVGLDEHTIMMIP